MIDPRLRLALVLGGRWAEDEGFSFRPVVIVGETARKPSFWHDRSSEDLMSRGNQYHDGCDIQYKWSIKIPKAE